MPIKDPERRRAVQRASQARWVAKPGNREKLRRANKQYKIRLAEYIREAKSVPCADCKHTYDPVCMDFDHLPGYSKVDDVASLPNRGSPNLIRAELVKCEVVCANCHRLRTKLRRQNIAGPAQTEAEYAEVGPGGVALY